MENKEGLATKTVDKLIDRAIRHCQNLRPEETGHGVTISYLREIKEQTKQLQEENAKLKKAAEGLAEIDDLLMRLEDYTHGKDGEDITKMRGKISDYNKLINGEGK